MNRVPSEEEASPQLESSAVLEDEDEASKWRYGHMSTKPIPEDRWGTAWRYVAPSELVEGMPYDIVSAGPDREFDTEDDLHNHMALVGVDGELREGMEDLGAVTTSVWVVISEPAKPNDATRPPHVHPV